MVRALAAEHCELQTFSSSHLLPSRLSIDNTLGLPCLLTHGAMMCLTAPMLPPRWSLVAILQYLCAHLYVKHSLPSSVAQNRYYLSSNRPTPLHRFTLLKFSAASISSLTEHDVLQLFLQTDVIVNLCSEL